MNAGPSVLERPQDDRALGFFEPANGDRSGWLRLVKHLTDGFALKVKHLNVLASTSLKETKKYFAFTYCKRYSPIFP